MCVTSGVSDSKTDRRILDRKTNISVKAKVMVRYVVFDVGEEEPTNERLDESSRFQANESESNKCNTTLRKRLTSYVITSLRL